MKKFYGDYWDSIEDMCNAFAIDTSELDGCVIIYAAYDTGDYEGWSHVIFSKSKMLFEVNGSHCSCNGLEGQWVPEETTLQALLFRPNVSLEAKANLKEIYPNLLAFL